MYESALDRIVIVYSISEINDLSKLSQFPLKQIGQTVVFFIAASYIQAHSNKAYSVSHRFAKRCTSVTALASVAGKYLDIVYKLGAVVDALMMAGAVEHWAVQHCL